MRVTRVAIPLKWANPRLPRIAPRGRSLPTLRSCWAPQRNSRAPVAGRLEPVLGEIWLFSGLIRPQDGSIVSFVAQYYGSAACAFLRLDWTPPVNRGRLPS